MKITEAYGAYDQISMMDPMMTMTPADTTVDARENNKIETLGDKVDLSGISQDLKLAREAVQAAPENPNERNERIETLRRSIESGSYQVHPEKIVDEMLRSGI